MDDIIFLLKNPHTSLELIVIKSMNVGEIFETHGPKACYELKIRIYFYSMLLVCTLRLFRIESITVDFQH